MPSAIGKHLHYLLFSCSSRSPPSTPHDDPGGDAPSTPPSSPDPAATSDSDALTPTAAAATSFSSGTTAASDLSSAIATRRLTVSSPGASNSIVDSAAAVEVGTAGVAVPRYSQEPEADFRQSMAEMAAAMGLVDPQEHGECLRELLLCYLALNGRHAHRYIVGAFADLLHGLEAAGAGVGTGRSGSAGA